MKKRHNLYATITHERCQPADSTKYPLFVYNSFGMQCGVLEDKPFYALKNRRCVLSALGDDPEIGFLTALYACKFGPFLHENKQWCNFSLVNMSTYAFLLGTRVGEADNPGPMETEKGKMGDVACAVCTPHAILSNKSAIMALEANVIFVFETSATNVVQNEFQKNIRYNHSSVFWSKPVCSKFSTIDDRFSLRGETMGTAVLTNLPHIDK